MSRVLFGNQIDWAFFLSFTYLMKVRWDIHLGRRPKLGRGGSWILELIWRQLSAACAFWIPSPRLVKCWPPKLGLWSHRLGAG